MAATGALVAWTVLTTAPVAASGISVYVAYADSARADATNFPTPWAGSPQTTFEGCAPVSACVYDAGAVRIVNNTTSTVRVDAVAVHLDTCTFTGWPAANLAPGADLIVTQLAAAPQAGCSGPAQLDTSDMGLGGSLYGGCTNDHLVPMVDVSINGVTTSYTDSGQILNTGGIDAGTCIGNESIQWTLVGSGPCHGSSLTLAPPAQTRPVFSTATVIATFANGCGQPLSNTEVGFSVLAGGPNAGRTGSGVTDAGGQALFSYGSAKTGTDTLQASIANLAGTIRSNTVTVTWTMFAGGGAFVISDLKDVPGGSVYWWGAQWWKFDHLSTGLAPASFKGFENGNPTPWCGETWTTRPGNSPHPPKSVSSVMAVIVASQVTKSGSTISGNIVHVVLVKTNPGYGPNPGHRGTGTIIAQLC